MSYFSYKNQSLHCEQVELNKLADEFGTPLYVYSASAIRDSFRRYANALSDRTHLVCYAVKSNSNLAVLNLLAKEGAGFDIVSEGELRRVLKAGGDPAKVIFSGVGKTAREITFALENNIRSFNVESRMELVRLNDIASNMNKVATVSIRVNPDVDANTHPYISTGLKENKFGIDIKEAPKVYELANSLSHIDVHGIDCHIGSQLVDTQPFLDALDRLLALKDELTSAGINITSLDLGGGVGVVYDDELEPDLEGYLTAVKKRVSENLELMFEPGRFISANAGVLLTEVQYLKRGDAKNFAIVDAAMNDNIRPSLYSAYQEVKTLNEPTQSAADEQRQWDIVGPVCESGDFLAKDRKLAAKAGERLALMSSGAYGFVMSSNYNTRGRAAEVLVDKDCYQLVREREELDTLFAGESVWQEPNRSRKAS